MESLNFVVGEICSLFEIIIVIDFICSSLGWKEKITHENKCFAILTIILFGLAQSKEIIAYGTSQRPALRSKTAEMRS